MNDNINYNIKCSICLNVLENDIISKWKCNHKFHSKCISTWNNGCPLCRNNILIDDIFIEKFFTDDKINNFDRLHNLKVSKHHHSIYLNLWKNKSCIDNNHNFLLVRPYGVIVICKTCKRYECYNLMHNIN